VYTKEAREPAEAGPETFLEKIFTRGKKFGGLVKTKEPKRFFRISLLVQVSDFFKTRAHSRSWF